MKHYEVHPVRDLQVRSILLMKAIKCPSVYLMNHALEIMANTRNIHLFMISKMYMLRINWHGIATVCSTLGPILQFDPSKHKSWLEVTPHQHKVHNISAKYSRFYRGYRSWPKPHYRDNRAPQLLQPQVTTCLSMILSTDVTELHKMVYTQLNYRACRAWRSRYWGRELKLNTGLSSPRGRERGSEGERERLKGKDFVRTS